MGKPRVKYSPKQSSLTSFAKRTKKKKRGEKMAKKGTKKKGHWQVILDDGTVVTTGYYPNARMAVGEALSKHKGRSVKDVKYIK